MEQATVGMNVGQATPGKKTATAVSVQKGESQCVRIWHAQHHPLKLKSRNSSIGAKCFSKLDLATAESVRFGKFKYKFVSYY